MTSPRVVELPRSLEPVTHDPFISDYGKVPMPELVRLSLLAVPPKPKPL